MSISLELSALKQSNKLLFQQGDSFQGNMPLTLYFCFDTNQDTVSEEVFAQMAEDGFAFAERMVFLYKDETASLHAFQKIAALYIEHVESAVYDEHHAVSHADQITPSWMNATMVLLSNGDVVPFDPVSVPNRMVMGNIAKHRFPDIWYSPLYMLLRETVEKKNFNFEYPAFSSKDYERIQQVFEHVDEWDDSFAYIDALLALEKKLAIEQKQLLHDAREKETQIESRIEELCAHEKQARKRHPIRSLLKSSAFSFSSTIREMFGGRVDQFGLLASVFPFDNVERDLNRALQGYGEAFHGNMPMRIELSILYGCNIRCFMCDLSKHSEEKQKEMLQQQMDEDTFRQLAEDVFPFVDNMIIGVAGEPTIHPKFPEYMRIASEAGLRMQVMTNGTSLSADRVCDAMARYVDEVVISMDGCTKETFEHIRTGANWERVLEGVRKLAKHRDDLPDSNLKISVNYALMKDNIDEFPRMFAFAKEMGINKVMGEHLIVTSPEIQDKSLFHYPDLSDQRLLEALENSKKFGIEIVIPELFNKQSQTQEVQQVTLSGIRPDEVKKDIPFCRLLPYSVVITPLSHVYPCCYPDAHRMLGVGMLKKKRFKQIWFGRGYQTLREGLRGAVPYPCSNCSMSGRSDGSVPIQKNQESREFLGKDHLFTPYAKLFMPRRLRFVDLLIRQNQSVQSHLANLDALALRIEEDMKKLGV
jgi:MoaA/NifB/PqqE/SkfB family radical SAM enzyme